jgi:hypothetical protein
MPKNKFYIIFFGVRLGAYFIKGLIGVLIQDTRILELSKMGRNHPKWGN